MRAGENSGRRSSWAVVATVSEPAPLLAAFVAHYLGLGAQKVTLYLDHWDEAAAELLAPVEGCELIDASAARAQELHGRPRLENINRRQRLNANHAYKRLEADWLLHLDADEYLCADGLEEELASLPPEAIALWVPNGERVYQQGVSPQTVFDGMLRRSGKIRPWQQRQLFGAEAAQYLHKGMTGHALGKSFVPRGRDLTVMNHTPRWSGEGLKEVTSERSVVVHFDGMTPLHWMLKLLRYEKMGLYAASSTDVQGRHRVAQAEFIRAQGNDVTAVRALHDMLRVVTPEQEAEQREAGLLGPTGVDPVAAVTRLLPEAGLDYSARAFNAGLAESYREFWEGPLPEALLDGL